MGNREHRTLGIVAFEAIAGAHVPAHQSADRLPLRKVYTTLPEKPPGNRGPDPRVAIRANPPVFLVPGRGGLAAVVQERRQPQNPSGRLLQIREARVGLKRRDH